MRSEIPYQEIIRLVLSWEGYTLSEARVKSRKRERVIARQIAFYFAKSMTDATLVCVGDELGKDHTTVLHAIKTVNNLIETDKDFRVKMWQYDLRLRHRSKRKPGIPFNLRIHRLTKYAYRNVLDAREIAAQASTLSEQAITKHIVRYAHFIKYYKRK